MERIAQQTPNIDGGAQDDELVMTLVELALEVPEQERSAYLKSACANDKELFRVVWNYVAAEQHMNGFMLDPLFPPLDGGSTFESGEVLDDRFRVVREVARGGMGIVYEAWDEKLHRRIAIKTAKPGFVKRLSPEVRHASDISHPNICKFFEIHTTSTPRGATDFITMEFLEGDTLAKRLTQGPISSDETRTIARQLCAGLAEAHRNGVIHGDLKSSNIILTKAMDGSTRAVITDFGLARAPGTSQRTMQSAAGGTPGYMAPELWRGEKATVASDIYALGVLIYEMISGRKPHEPPPGSIASTITLPERAWQERFTQVPAPVGPKWDRLLARCLDPDPAKRYRTADEVRQALEPRSRRWFVVTGIAAAVAIVSALVTYNRATAPQQYVRLAVLPFQADAEMATLSQGLLLDLGDHLSHLRPGRTKVTVFGVSETLQNRVDQPEKAKRVLGATHALEGRFHKTHGSIEVQAYLIDTRTHVRLKEWRADYHNSELRNLPLALAGIVTGTLALPPLQLGSPVNAAAYPDYIAGVSLAKKSTSLDRAIPLLEHAVALDNGAALTHAKLAEAQFMKFRLTRDPFWSDQALMSLKNAEQRNPDLAEVRFVSGLVHESFGQYTPAQADYLRAIELEPSNADAWRRLGSVYENNNQPQQALGAYLKAVEVDPGYFKSYQDLGGFYFTTGDYEQAVEQYKKMVELVPDLASAHYALAAPYLNLGRYSEAEKELQLALSYQETADAVLGLGLSRMYQARDLEAIPYFERALKIGPATSLFYVNLGTALRRSKFGTRAMEAYRTGLNLAEANLARNPRNAYERACLAYFCARLGEGRRAESEVAQALQISGDAVNVRWMAALTYEVLGKRDRTLALVQDGPASLVDRLSRFPDLADLSTDPRFQQLRLSRHAKQ